MLFRSSLWLVISAPTVFAQTATSNPDGSSSSGDTLGAGSSTVYGTGDEAIECFAEPALILSISAFDGLAQACVLDVGAKCARWKAPEGQEVIELTFSGLNNFIQTRAIQQNTPQESFFDSITQDLGNLISKTDICRIKCRCLESNTKPYTTVPNVQQPIYTSIVAFEDDRPGSSPTMRDQHSRRTPAFRSETITRFDSIQYIEGLNFYSHSRLDQVETDAQVLNVRSIHNYIPECNLTPLPDFLTAALNAHHLPTYPHAQSLCTHAIHGGHRNTSMGGFCHRLALSPDSPASMLAGGPLQWRITFPPPSRAPALSGSVAFTAHSPYGYELGDAVEAYCEMACECEFFTHGLPDDGSRGPLVTSQNLNVVRYILNGDWSGSESSDGLVEESDEADSADASSVESRGGSAQRSCIKRTDCARGEQCRAVATASRPGPKALWFGICVQAGVRVGLGALGISATKVVQYGQLNIGRG